MLSSIEICFLQRFDLAEVQMFDICRNCKQPEVQVLVDET